METLLWLLGYALVAGICVLVGRGMWRAWVRHRITRQKEQTLERVIRAREGCAPRYPWHPTEDDYRPCMLPPAGWTCSRAAGHDGPCAARPKRQPLLLRPGQIIECDRADQEQMSWTPHMYAQEAERVPTDAAEALSFLGDVFTYLLTRNMADTSCVEILDRAIADVSKAARYTRPRARRVMADDLAEQWRLGR